MNNSFAATPYPWTKEGETVVEWGAKVRKDQNDGRLPEPGDRLVVTSKSGRSDTRIAVEVRTFSNGDAAAVKTVDLPEDAGSEPLPFDRGGAPAAPVPAPDPAGPAPSGEAMRALGKVDDIETRLTMVESDADRLKARLNKAAGVIKAMAERLEQAEQREADWRRQVEARLEELAKLAAPEPPDNWESDDADDADSSLPF